MHFLLIGSSGYVGTEFAKQLAERGHRMTALGRSNCDLYSESALVRAFETHARMR